MKKLLINTTALIGSALFLSSSIAMAGDAAMGAKSQSFSALDTDQDKVISQQEISVNKNLAQLFEKADANMDGTLDENEYTALISLSGTASN